MAQYICEIPNLSELVKTKFYKIFCQYIVNIEREFNHYQQLLPRSQRLDTDYNNIVAVYLRNIFHQCFDRLNIAFTILNLTSETSQHQFISNYFEHSVCK